ncbi:4Fe-4S ferredoxin [Methanosphaerula palustris]|uniref:4Fe-4S ferredoxin, iron-sulfur binding protein n=1 Tax=Methanosphaerula palustris (strain ATCC BAA-1556 / DSM 19958 / E1-9c) TaxID=521011 RepID=B8GG13_METPE|nr:4Fe-4S ferredoxin [Methanosphaerula palustris]ACL16087.1 4Fe-4S ferredoxin, iron-sulfur binding protein [Methanosphaerula palustris E1-9c]
MSPTDITPNEEKPIHQDLQMANDDVALWLERIIKEYWMHSPENRMGDGGEEKAFDEPLLGFSNGDDPLYREIQADVGSPCLTPVEVFERAFPGCAIAPDELTVISWVLPQNRATRKDNKKETFYPSERWIRAKHFGKEFNIHLSQYVVQALHDAGSDAVVPTQTPFFTIEMTQKYGLASSWSDRHAAYVSGLGTFGLCDGLITPRGKAMICGSVIARLSIPPTPRPYQDHHAYCLYFSQGTCGLCMRRCPVNAISDHGHDKNRCRVHCFEVAQPYARERFGIDEYGCGLCQTGVPCESGIPVRRRSSDSRL